MFGNYLTTFRGLHRNVRLYLLATALLGFAIDGGIYSVVFNLYLVRLGFGPTFIGQINAAGLLTFALASLPAGALGSWLGYRAMMVAGLILMIGGGVLMPMAQVIAEGSPAMGLIASYVAIYMGLSFYFVNAVPFIMEYTVPRLRGYVFSIQTGLLALAAVGGSLIGGFLPRLFAQALNVPQTQPDPYRYPLFIGVALMAPAVFALLLARRDTAATSAVNLDLYPTTEGRHGVAPTHALAAGASIAFVLVAISVIRFFQVSGVGAAATFFNVYMDTQLHVPTAAIGLIAALARLLSAPAAMAVPFLVMRWSAVRVVLAVSLLTSLFLLPLAFSPGWGAAGMGFIGVIVVSAMRYPAYLTFSMELVPVRWRGVLSGAGEMAGGLSFALTAFVGGYVIVGRGYTALFAAAAVLTLVGTLLFWAYASTPRPRRRRALVGASGAD